MNLFCRENLELCKAPENGDFSDKKAGAFVVEMAGFSAARHAGGPVLLNVKSRDNKSTEQTSTQELGSSSWTGTVQVEFHDVGLTGNSIGSR